MNTTPIIQTPIDTRIYILSYLFPWMSQTARKSLVRQHFGYFRDDPTRTIMLVYPTVSVHFKSESTNIEKFKQLVRCPGVQALVILQSDDFLIKPLTLRQLSCLLDLIHIAQHDRPQKYVPLHVFTFMGDFNLKTVANKLESHAINWNYVTVSVGIRSIANMYDYLKGARMLISVYTNDRNDERNVALQLVSKQQAQEVDCYFPDQYSKLRYAEFRYDSHFYRNTILDRTCTILTDTTMIVGGTKGLCQLADNISARFFTHILPNLVSLEIRSSPVNLYADVSKKYKVQIYVAFAQILAALCDFVRNNLNDASLSIVTWGPIQLEQVQSIMNNILSRCKYNRRRISKKEKIYVTRGDDITRYSYSMQQFNVMLNLHVLRDAGPIDVQRLFSICHGYNYTRHVHV